MYFTLQKTLYNIYPRVALNQIKRNLFYAEPYNILLSGRELEKKYGDIDSNIGGEMFRIP